MLTLTIENFSPELYGLLKNSALAHQRTVNGEIFARLETSLRPKRVHPETFLARIDAIHQQLSGPLWLTEEILEQAKAEGRK